MTFAHIQWFYTRYNMKEAAAAIGIGVTTLKRLSRTFGFDFWPNRKVRSGSAHARHPSLTPIAASRLRLSVSGARCMAHALEGCQSAYLTLLGSLALVVTRLRAGSVCAYPHLARLSLLEATHSTRDRGRTEGTWRGEAIAPSAFVCSCVAPEVSGPTDNLGHWEVEAHKPIRER